MPMQTKTWMLPFNAGFMAFSVGALIGNHHLFNLIYYTIIFVVNLLSFIYWFKRPSERSRKMGKNYDFKEGDSITGGVNPASTTKTRRNDPMTLSQPSPAFENPFERMSFMPTMNNYPDVFKVGDTILLSAHHMIDERDRGKKAIITQIHDSLVSFHLEGVEGNDQRFCDITLLVKVAKKIDSSENSSSTAAIEEKKPKPKYKAGMAIHEYVDAVLSYSDDKERNK